jgi:hypothetical protein
MATLPAIHNRHRKVFIFLGARTEMLLASAQTASSNSASPSSKADDMDPLITIAEDAYGDVRFRDTG